jgi:hypothetical protein
MSPAALTILKENEISNQCCIFRIYYLKYTKPENYTTVFVAKQYAT